MDSQIEFTSFADIVEKSTRLKSYLQDNGILLNPSSVLARAMNDAEEILRLHNTGKIPKGYDSNTSVSDAANVLYLCDTILAAARTSFEPEMKKHLNKLASGNPLLLKSEKQSNARDLTFELMSACACSLFASNVKFDEPDLLVDYKGISWGLACKTVYNSAKSTHRAIRKGIEQIYNSKADFGLVIVQLTNIFPHNKMFWIDTTSGDIISFHHASDLLTLMTKLGQNIVSEINAESTDYFRKFPLKENHRVRAIIYLTQTICYYRARRLTMGTCFFTPMVRILGPEKEFCDMFNECLQKAVAKT